MFNLIENPIVVLLYHRVNALSLDPQLLHISTDNFHAQMKYLKENCHILAIEEVSDFIKNKKKLPPNCVYITFDDGYADNFNQALPILDSLNIQALFSIATYHINSPREFWWDDLERIFLIKNNLPKKITLKIKNKSQSFDTSSKINLEKNYYKTHGILKDMEHEERQKIVAALLREAGLPLEGRPTHRLMSHEEIRQMSASPHAVIGAHTHTHTPLSILTYDEQYEEIKRCQSILEGITHKKIKYLCYPFGKKTDYDNHSIRLVREIGFDIAFANYFQQVHSWSNIYELPRFLVRDWDFEYFKFQINKFFKFQ